MKKKVLLSSIATIALCLCLIAGSTYALFTTSDAVDVSVTAGQVKLTAEYDTSSMLTWSLHETEDDAREDGSFVNGGTATFKDEIVEINLMTPGDVAKFKIDVTNYSNVGIQYRVRMISVAENGVTDLTPALVTTASIDGFNYPVTGEENATAWKYIDKDKAINDIWITVSFPNGTEEHDNQYQDAKAKMTFIVEAVQGNAETVNEVETGTKVVAATQEELSRAIEAGMNVVLTSNIELTKTLVTKKDVVIDLNGKTITAAPSGCLFQSQSNAAPDLTITSSVAGAEINVTGGDTSILLGYGSTEIKNVTLNVTGCDNSSPNPFKVYGDLTLGEGTVVNVDYLGTALISNNGEVDIVIDGAKINIDTFKTNGTAIITLNQASTLEIKNTEISIDNFVRSTFGGDSLVSKVNGVTIENCTFNVTDSNGASCTFEAKDGKYRLVQK